MDTLIYFLGLVFVAWAFYRVGHLVGSVEGSWGPPAIKRLTAAREDAFANGVRHGSQQVTPHREPLEPAELEKRFATFMEPAE